VPNPEPYRVSNNSSEKGGGGGRRFFFEAGSREKLARAFPTIDTLFAEFRLQRKAPGAAFGIVVDSELAHAGGSGVRQLRPDAPALPDTIFRIASMTKSVTAACVLLLRDEGRLTLDDHVLRYVPELAGLAPPTADSPPLTIRQLLTMSAGFVEDNPWGDRQLAMSDGAFGAMLARGIPFNRPPGIGFEYSNLSYAVLGRVVGRVAGEPLADIAMRRIFLPLRMESTFWDVADVPQTRRAHGYRLAGEDWEEETPLPHGAFAPMGGMWTTIRDFARYVAFQLAAWPPRDDFDPGPLRRSSAREMQQSGWLWPGPAATEPPRSVSGYGYGLVAGLDAAGRRVVSHGGGLPGFSSHVQWMPDYGVGVIGFANLPFSLIRDTVGEAIELLSATGGLVPRSRPPSAELLAARQAVLRLYERWDDAAAESLAADNLFLDRPAAQRRQEFERLRSEHGPCLEPGDLVPQGEQRGTWRMTCAHGEIDGDVWMAPTPELKVQTLSLQSHPAADKDTPGCPPRPASSGSQPSTNWRR
jgi:CubicO group peptidase (beta-lactamase class C family)